MVSLSSRSCLHIYHLSRDYGKVFSSNKNQFFKGRFLDYIQGPLKLNHGIQYALKLIFIQRSCLNELFSALWSKAI